MPGSSLIWTQTGAREKNWFPYHKFLQKATQSRLECLILASALLSLQKQRAKKINPKPAWFALLKEGCKVFLQWMKVKNESLIGHSLIVSA